jgi:MFS family permease
VFAALAFPVYRRVWAAGFVSSLGDWMQIFGRGALAYELTGTASSVGVVYFATYLPQMLFSLWGGVLADRFDRRRLLIATQVLQAAGALTVGVLVATGTAHLWNVGVLSFAMGIGFMLAIPASQALLPNVVPRDVWHSAISFGTATNSATRVVGPLLGALVVEVLGLEWIFWVNAVSFLAVIGAWTATRVPRQPPIEETRNLDAMRTAVRFVRARPAIWVPMLVATVLASVGIVYQPLSIAYATEVLADADRDLGVRLNGFVQAAIGLGAAAGILGLAGAGRRRPGATLVATAVAFSVALVALGAVTTTAPALVVAAGLGAMQFANMTLAINLVQLETPEILRGRVMAMQMTGLIGFVPLASLGGGALADAVGIRGLFVGAGAVCLAFSVVAVRWRGAVREQVDAVSDDAIAALGVLEEEG